MGEATSRGRHGTTRRGFLVAAGSVAGAAAGAGGGYALAARDDGGRAGDAVVPFAGARQAGIATAAQDRLVFGAFDVTATDAADVRALLAAWTAAAARMTRGETVASDRGAPAAPPLDTGEALGLAPARLTITVGLGPTLFDRDGRDRFGFVARRPSALRELEALPGDDLERARSGGDLCVQACADDPQVAFHAVRNLARLGRGTVALRWLQLGFGRTSATTDAQGTPRNLQGFLDGTNNIKGDDPALLAQHVWIGDEEPQAWFRGGTYLVARRIRMLIESWDRTGLGEQEQTIGRSKTSGAPLGARHEHDPVDLAARGPDGLPLIPLDAHIRLASHVTNGGIRLLRRGYSFTDGIDPVTGELDAGLFFISFQRDPERFAIIQRRLGATDHLNEYISHTASAVFAIPPGSRHGEPLGAGLFGGAP